jgi:hypothetical protein
MLCSSHYDMVARHAVYSGRVAVVHVAALRFLVLRAGDCIATPLLLLGVLPSVSAGGWYMLLYIACQQAAAAGSSQI